MEENKSSLTCPKCGGHNCNVSVVQTSAKTRTKNKGILYTIGRWTLIICTFGLWLVFGKKNAKSSTTFVNEKMATCQSCGHTWSLGKVH